MVTLPNDKELQVLKVAQDEYCVSIYAPFLDPNAANNPNRIELKNQLKRAETLLADKGADPTTIHKMLRGAYRLLETEEFWPIQHSALTLFIRPGHTDYYRLPPDNITPAVTVNQHFDLRQLTHALRTNEPYYVLSLSHNGVRLFAGDRDQLEPVDIPDIAGTMEEVLRLDEYPNSRELHGVGPANLGKGSEGYHQQYNNTETDKAMLLEFFRLVDRRLHHYLNRQKRPLIIAGVTYLLPIYRKANTYPRLLAKSIRGNIQRDTLDAIRARAWQVISQGQAAGAERT